MKLGIDEREMIVQAADKVAFISCKRIEGVDQGLGGRNQNETEVHHEGRDKEDDLASAGHAQFTPLTGLSSRDFVFRETSKRGLRPGAISRSTVWRIIHKKPRLVPADSPCPLAARSL